MLIAIKNKRMMKRLTLLSICWMIIQPVFSQKYWKSDKRMLKKHFSQIQNGNSSFWLHKTEVSNNLYRIFLAEINEEERLQNLPDSSSDEVSTHLQVYFRIYSRAIMFDDYPVVNISRASALAFCKWYEKKLNDNSSKGEKYRVDLPSQADWLFAARGGNPDRLFPWDGASLRNEKGQFRANFTYIPQSWIKRTEDEFSVVQISSEATSIMRSDILAPVYSYWPNEYGLYNMVGNAAEMCAESGRTKGGSWKDTGFYMLINAPDPYKGNEEPSPFVGFRMKVKKLN